jgi:hypothetical protein
LDLWRECSIIDVSTLGVGIDLCHPDPIELLGLWKDGELRLDMSRSITLRLALGPSVDMTVAGEVRNAGSGPDGTVRAGIEFIDLTEVERSIVELLERRAAAQLSEPTSLAQHDDVLDQLADGPQTPLGSRRMPIGLPVYELITKSVSYVTNRPLVGEATRSLDLVSRPLCTILGSCHGWLAKSWRAAQGIE